ncbi:hypothetical protein SUGI_0253480 [Cryptomeria japonica]|nr:hypothetical protein SUGI_0253480 [Cryptomeria japonica]
MRERKTSIQRCNFTVTNQLPQIQKMAPSLEFARDAVVVANTQIDWKETVDAHIFKADLPGLKKVWVKIEVEDGRILQISRECSKEEEQNKADL